MTQIVLMLYEDPQADKTSDKRFHIELHFSPGVKCNLEEAASKESKLSIFHEEHKSVAFRSTKIEIKPKQTEVGQEKTTGPAQPLIIPERICKSDASMSKEQDTEAKQADSSEQEREDLVDGKNKSAEKLLPKCDVFDETGAGQSVPGDRTYPGSGDEKRMIIARRQKNGRSRSECEYPAIYSDDSGSNSDRSPLRYKGISKSLGMRHVCMHNVKNFRITNSIEPCLHCTGFTWSPYKISCMRGDLVHKVIII